MKTGLLSYSRFTDNLGDYIQSIATAKLVGHYDTMVERELLNRYEGDPLKMVLNGWFMENPGHWPPSPSIHPLFISFHINPTAATEMLSEEGIRYLKKWAPIGCRDYYTLARLHEKNIDAYFSGCATLTLKRDQFVPSETRRENILVVGVLDRIITKKNWRIRPFRKNLFINGTALLKFPVQFLKYRVANRFLSKQIRAFDSPVVKIDQLHDMRALSEKKRLKKASDFLTEIAKARLVITSRIHTALPAAAFGTPVIFLEDGLEHINHYSRIIGLNRFFKICKASELHKIDLKELKNSGQHDVFSKLISKKVKEFIASE